MSKTNTFKIERTSQEKGYIEEELGLQDALKVLNSELENERKIFIDGRPFEGDIIQEEDLKSYKKSICITNKLIGG